MTAIAAQLQHRLPAAGARRSARRRASRILAARTIELDGGAVVFAPERRRPKGVVHFLGGAFVAATPHLVYPLLLEALADGGYTVVTTPYAVTFNHIDCARRVHSSFEAALAQLRGGRGAWAAPPGAPTHGLGHSNGALLHALIGAVCVGSGGSSGGEAAAARASNVLMCFNNLQVAEAVPVPLGLLQPAVQQLRGGGRLESLAQVGLAQAAGVAQQLLALSPAAALPPLRQQQEQLLAAAQQWDPALLQLGSVFDEVGDGYQDFFPPPTETRQLIGADYAVPATLLVQFTNDNTDETPEVEAILRADWSAGSPASSRGGGGASAAGAPRAIERQLLPGSHVTPCGGDAGWRLAPGQPFTPVDAVALAAKAVLQADNRRLADRVLAWLDAHS